MRNLFALWAQAPDDLPPMRDRLSFPVVAVPWSESRPARPSSVRLTQKLPSPEHTSVRRDSPERGVVIDPHPSSQKIHPVGERLVVGWWARLGWLGTGSAFDWAGLDLAGAWISAGHVRCPTATNHCRIEVWIGGLAPCVVSAERDAGVYGRWVDARAGRENTDTEGGKHLTWRTPALPCQRVHGGQEHGCCRRASGRKNFAIRRGLRLGRTSTQSRAREKVVDSYSDTA